MNYTDLLNRIIEKSGLKNIEIIDRLNDYNIKITKSYLSVLRNDKEKKASDELSRAIAEICGAPKSILVIQAQLDRASDELKQYIDFSVDNSRKVVRTIIESLPKENQGKLLEDLEAMETADIICDAIEHPENYTTRVEELIQNISNKAKKKQKYALIPIASEDIKIISEDKIKKLNR